MWLWPMFFFYIVYYGINTNSACEDMPSAHGSGCAGRASAPGLFCRALTALCPCTTMGPTQPAATAPAHLQSLLQK